MLHHGIVKAWVGWEFVSSRTEFKTSLLPLQSTKASRPITQRAYYPTILHWHPQVNNQQPAPVSPQDKVCTKGDRATSRWWYNLHSHPESLQTMDTLKKTKTQKQKKTGLKSFCFCCSDVSFQMLYAGTTTNTPMFKLWHFH